MAEIALGEVLFGRLRIDHVLGRGGMGVVYAATDLRLDRRVALKLMTGDHADTEQRERFDREARAAASLQSKHVAHVLEAGHLDDGRPFYVMEHLEGRTLDQIVEDDGPLAPARAVDHALEALDAIAEAHEAGLVHRDLKPSNLFLSEDPAGPARVKVLDFGVVKETLAPDKLTRTGTSLGTPAYMAPEQIRAGSVDARTDVWGMGATIYELVTGVLPFDASSVPAMLKRVLDDAPVPLHRVRPEIPLALEEVVARCLEKDPAARYPTARDLADALRTIRSALPEVDDTRETVHLGSEPVRYPRGSVPTFDSPSKLIDRPPEVDAAIAAERHANRKSKKKERERGRSTGLVLGLVIGPAVGVFVTGGAALYVLTHRPVPAPPVPSLVASVVKTDVVPSVEPTASTPPTEAPSASVRTTPSRPRPPNGFYGQPTNAVSTEGDVRAWVDVNHSALTACAQKQTCGPISVRVRSVDGKISAFGSFAAASSRTLKVTDRCEVTPALETCVRAIAERTLSCTGTCWVTIRFE